MGNPVRKRTTTGRLNNGRFPTPCLWGEIRKTVADEVLRRFPIVWLKGLFLFDLRQFDGLDLQFRTGHDEAEIAAAILAIGQHGR